MAPAAFVHEVELKRPLAPWPSILSYTTASLKEVVTASILFHRSISV